MTEDFPPPEKNPERKKLKSTKLDRTLAELENAFDTWNSTVPVARAQIDPGAAAPLLASPAGESLKSRTRELLSQLREQIADLSED